MAVQVTISLLLLVGAGLFVRTLSNLRAEALGFRADHLLLFEMNGTLNGYKDDRLQRLYDEVYAGVAAIPGVTSASVSRWGLLSGNATADGVKVPGQKDAIHAAVHNIFPGYFKTMGVPLLLGRDVSDTDTAIGAARRHREPGPGREGLRHGARRSAARCSSATRP